MFKCISAHLFKYQHIKLKDTNLSNFTLVTYACLNSLLFIYCKKRVWGLFLEYISQCSNSYGFFFFFNITS